MWDKFNFVGWINVFHSLFVFHLHFILWTSLRLFLFIHFNFWNRFDNRILFLGFFKFSKWWIQWIKKGTTSSCTFFLLSLFLYGLLLFSLMIYSWFKFWFSWRFLVNLWFFSLNIHIWFAFDCIGSRFNFVLIATLNHFIIVFELIPVWSDLLFAFRIVLNFILILFISS